MGEDAINLDASPELRPHAQNLHFAMQSNGYYLTREGKWIHRASMKTPFKEEFKGQNVSFFGPGGGSFYSGHDVGSEQFTSAFDQQSVTKAIAKYRSIDQDQAARIAFLLGGIVRHFSPEGVMPGQNREFINSAVDFVANMTKLGDTRSADALASAMAMYVVSGGPLDDDRHFVGNMYYMAEAIAEDPVKPTTTPDLGLSQVARLRAFETKIQHQAVEPLPPVEDEAAFDAFPTVGAEFHLPITSARKNPDIWKKLALLNMSQYQRGSYIQLSRNDRDVIEVRMNPSIYPITIANWSHMKQLVPELNRAFFWITLNRRGLGTDFSWNTNDVHVLNKLKALGMLSYATVYEDFPHAETHEEVDFGNIYLGQTVRFSNGNYHYTGGWSGGEDGVGQLSMYTGFGDNLPYLAYYTSMTLADPHILDPIPHEFIHRARRIGDALNVRARDRKGFFAELRGQIRGNEMLRRADVAGERIMEELSL